MDKKEFAAKKVSAAFAALITLGPVVYIAVFGQGALFLLYLAWYVLLPGHLLYRVVFRGNGGAAVRLLSSFYLGLALLFSQYYLLELAGALWPLRFISPAVALFEIFSVARRRIKNKTQGTGLRHFFISAAENHLFVWLLCIAVCYSFYILNIRYSTPDTIYNSDLHWHMGNIYTLSKPGFQDIRVEGMFFKYHYFSDLFFAVGRVAVGLVPFNCVMRFPVLITPLLVTASVYELTRTAAHTRLSRAFFSLCLMLFVPLFGRYNDIAYQWLTNLNAVGLALPCGLLLLIFVRDRLLACPGKNIAWRDAALAFVFIVMLSGLKGPFGVSVLGAFAAFTVYALVKHLKPGAGWYVAASCVAVGFLVMWFTLLSSGLNDAYILSDRLAASVKHADILVPAINALGDNLFARLVLLPVQFILVGGMFAVPFVVMLVRVIGSLFRKKESGLDAFTVFCTLGAFVSLGAYYYFDMLGRSQNYFLYFAVPMMAYPAITEIVRWAKKLSGTASLRKKAAKIALAAVMLAAVVFAGFNPMLEDEISLYSAGELGAIAWIEENVPEDSLLMVNRHETFYLISGFTGRQVYVEGVYYAKNSGVTLEMLEDRIALNDELFHSDTTTERRIEIVRQTGADYIVQWRNSYANPELSNRFEQGFTAAYVSDDVVIWQLAQNKTG